MKAIIDENLPGRLCNWLAARGCIATHVRDIGLASTSDDAVWAHARQTAAVVISRDSDFIDIARREGQGCAVQLKLGNCTTAELLAWLEPRWASIEARVSGGEIAIEV
jgi:predicted nuclease of predicted toxin-antitoxin system